MYFLMNNSVVLRPALMWSYSSYRERENPSDVTDATAAAMLTSLGTTKVVLVAFK